MTEYYLHPLQARSPARHQPLAPREEDSSPSRLSGLTGRECAQLRMLPATQTASRDLTAPTIAGASVKYFRGQIVSTTSASNSGAQCHNIWSHMRFAKTLLGAHRQVKKIVWPLNFTEFADIQVQKLIGRAV